MNNHQNSLTRINDILGKSASGVIIIPNNPTVDAIAGATALYLAISKMGKNISISCSTKIQSDLTASDKVQSTIATGGNSLMISFPYNDGSIDKVDYNIQGSNFNLIVTPRPGFPKLNPQMVNYSYTGGVVDFIITIDAPSLNSLGQIYTDNQTQFTGHEIINIDRHLTNAFFGTVNLVNKTSSSVSELILAVIQSTKIEIDKDIATNLYAGIASSTNNFTSYSVNAETFENIATLMRQGAVKRIIKKPTNTSIFNPIPVVNQTTTPEVQKAKPIESVEKENLKEKPATGENWLKPKIFKDGSIF